MVNCWVGWVALPVVACLLFPVIAHPAGAGDGDVTIHVTYDEMYEEVRPKPRRGVVKQNIAFTPLEGGMIRVVYVRTGFPIQAETADVMLGSPGEGRFRNVRWSRENDGARYVRVQATNTYVMTLTASIEAQTCKADVRFELRPGSSEYQMVRRGDPTEKVYLKTLRAANVKCWIGDYLVS
jgi:hypothetical protein